jgi:hypothetical protein
MYPYGKEEGDYGFEFAPTGISEISGLDASNVGLQWHRSDLNKRLTVMLNDLPK